MSRSSVRIYEVSPRDGLQNEASVVPTAAKAELIARLGAAGVRDIEVTSFVRPHWIPQLADAAELLAILGKVPPSAAHDRELVNAWAAAIGMTGWYAWIPYKP